MQVGDRVRDKFKTPKPGDDSSCGQIIEVDAEMKLVRIQMDTGFPPVRLVTFDQFDMLFEPEEG